MKGWLKSMKKIFDDFTHCYSLSKTLRFRLIPQLKTSENIKKYNIISDGEKRSNNYHDVKPLFDRCHRQFIDLSLKDFEYDWKPLYNALLSFRKDRSDKSKEMLQNEQKECQKAISSYIKRCPEYKKLEPKTIIDDLSKGENFFGLSDKEKDKIKDFKGFSTYFQGYKEVRENIYSEKAFVSVAYRSVMENFPKFADNITRYLSLPHEIKNNLNNALKDLLCGYHLDEIFSVGFFNEVLTQKGIDFYNNILGGFNYNDNVKIQGINEYLNLLFQQKKLEKKTKFTPLFKQILSDRIKVSFLPEQFSSYEELAAALKEYSVLLCGTLEKANTASNPFNNDDIDTAKIYIPQNEISFLSQLLFDNNWQMLHEKMQEAGLKKASEYTLYEVQEVCGMNILSIISNAFAAACKEILSAQKTMLFAINTSPDPCYNEIKAYLDKVQEAEKLLKIFAVSGELEKDAAFYTDSTASFRINRIGLDHDWQWNQAWADFTGVNVWMPEYYKTFNCVCPAGTCGCSGAEQECPRAEEGCACIIRDELVVSDAGKFDNYWFQTGTPMFLVKLLQTNDYNLQDLKGIYVDESVLLSVDEDHADPIPVLFQSGYLTITDYDAELGYRLDFPNREVERGFFDFLMPLYASINKSEVRSYLNKLTASVRQGRPDDLLRTLQSMLSGKPYMLAGGDKEVHFQNTLYLIFVMLGYNVQVEQATSQGRMDVTIQTPEYVYILELKLDKSAEEALQQIKDNQYARPFQTDGRKVFLIGANFSSETRTVEKWLVGEFKEDSLN